jgi:hypothetical protein
MLTNSMPWLKLLNVSAILVLPNKSFKFWHRTSFDWFVVLILRPNCGPGYFSVCSDWLRDEQYGDQTPGGGEIVRICPDRLWGPARLLYDGYWVFPGGSKRLGRDAELSPLLVPRSEYRVGLSLYSPSGPSWPVERFKPTYLRVNYY